MSQADILAQMRKLKDSKIDSPAGTLDIREQAVTNVVSAYTDGSISLPYKEETTIQECTIEATGSPIFIIWSFKLGTATIPEWCLPALYRDTTLLYQTSTCLGIAEATGASITDSPVAGTYTYYLKVEDEDDDGSAQQRSMMLLEVKR